MRVSSALYLDDYTIEVTFSDNTVKKVDFWPFLKKNDHPLFNKYRNIDAFKQFMVDKTIGNIVWGKDWDLIFPIAQLYKGEILT